VLTATLALALGLAALSAAAKTLDLPKSVDVKLPDGLEMFSGAGADAINNNCLACHSRGMVLNQPAMAKPAWEAEVAKMRNVYKAPVNESDVPAIVDYLVRIKGPK
jgi:hypothetical protein